MSKDLSYRIGAVVFSDGLAREEIMQLREGGTNGLHEALVKEGWDIHDARDYVNMIRKLRWKEIGPIYRYTLNAIDIASTLIFEIFKYF